MYCKSQYATQPQRIFRFCCKNYNDWNVIFTSKLNPTPINFFTRKDRIELEFRYRWINGSVDDLPKTTNGYDDYLYPK